MTPGKRKQGGVDLAELQQQLFRFADQILERLLVAADEPELANPQMTCDKVQRSPESSAA